MVESLRGEGGGPLELVPTTLREANLFVERHHRHSRPVRGCVAVVAVAQAGEVVGVAIVGRPVARHLQDGWTAEVTRVCTTGARNACSKLYAAAWRAVRALGYRRLMTYTLASESGASVSAAGFRIVGEVRREGWDRPGRPRVDEHELHERLRWEVSA